MDINVSTPSILFPAISLLLLAFTNRFLALANLIRQLHDQYKLRPEPALLAQMAHLQQRLLLIRNMQACGVASLVMCIICIGLVLLSQPLLALVSFVLSLLLMLASLALSLREILISYRALAMHLADIEELHDQQSAFRRR
ncbi:uncharacterized protein DUF2721 [Paraperlucidibaca baekdonensis]|uniref:Uncharacterized protein DUF2721 n=1 Tax=Paraperlucidibaca baekdonensis TaxID=748120 RepID=A0A3E0H1Y9_9GAMM|nr:DUF2721 domain-containing protein [Paraperlucidibaca baekdonensis]REH36876.1 uncharacterized protein DUF2721 [Paraperlucidibaca baekdonensis]